MPVAYKIVEKSISALVKNVAVNKKFQKGLLGVGAPILGWLYYDKKTNPPKFPDPVLPSKKKTDTYEAPANPSLQEPMNDLIEKMNQNTETSNKNFDTIFKDIESRRASFVTDNKAMLEANQNSPFLSQQILAKDTFDNINQNLEAQTIMLGLVWETLEKNLSALVAVKMMDAQNNKVNADYQKTMAANSDNGEFFYEFIPTAEFWSKADEAKVLYDSMHGYSTSPNYLPSRFHAGNELSLIDRMQGKNTKAEVRKAVEDYRQSNLASDVRALIGYTAIAQVKDQVETNSYAKQYYATATESLKANETAKAVNSLVTAVAPVSKWAEKAEVREAFLTTAVDAKDLDGNIVMKAVAPMTLTAIKDATIAREKTDTINFTVDESDFPSFDSFPVLPFVGREHIFNPEFSMPTNNPFTHKNIGETL